MSAWRASQERHVSDLNVKAVATDLESALLSTQ